MDPKMTPERPPNFDDKALKRRVSDSIDRDRKQRALKRAAARRKASPKHPPKPRTKLWAFAEPEKPSNA
jgi:hypothetical protein